MKTLYLFLVLGLSLTLGACRGEMKIRVLKVYEPDQAGFKEYQVRALIAEVTEGNDFSLVHESAPTDGTRFFALRPKARDVGGGAATVIFTPNERTLNVMISAADEDAVATAEAVFRRAIKRHFPAATISTQPVHRGLLGP